MKQLDINNSKDLTALKESLNAVIDKKIAKQQLSEKLQSISDLSFGEYKCLFEDIMPTLSNSNDGKKIIASYVKLLKENKAINTIYKVYESVGVSSSDDKNIAAYALADIMENVNKQELTEGEQKMYSIYKNACSLVDNVTCESIDAVLNESKKVNDAVNYLTHNSDKSNIKTLNERVNSIKVLGEFINENVANGAENSENEKTNSELLSELNNLFINEHTEWENQVLKDLTLCYMSNDNVEQLFESYKSKCIKAIDEIDSESGDVAEKSRLYGMKQQLSEKKYNADTLIDDLFNLAELKETLLTE